MTTPPSTRPVAIAGLTIGGGAPLALIGGPCAIEDERHALMMAERLQRMTADARVPFIYKSSYDKANRSSATAYRGPGLTEGLRILRKVATTVGVPVLSDVHDVSEVGPAADVLDVLQIPAFLCRQTDLLVAAARTGKPVNVKKGQFLAPLDMRHVVGKLEAAGAQGILVTERGSTFGYNNLVVDMRALPMLRSLGHPVVFDVTHSLQLPGAGEGTTTGLAEYIDPLARAGVAAGVDAVFMEVHEDPSRARSDAGNALKLDRLEPLLQRLVALDRIARSND